MKEPHWGEADRESKQSTGGCNHPKHQ